MEKKIIYVTFKKSHASEASLLNGKSLKILHKIISWYSTVVQFDLIAKNNFQFTKKIYLKYFLLLISSPAGLRSAFAVPLILFLFLFQWLSLLMSADLFVPVG